jgi:hypothetical protein
MLGEYGQIATVYLITLKQTVNIHGIQDQPRDSEPRCKVYLCWNAVDTVREPSVLEI